MSTPETDSVWSSGGNILDHARKLEAERDALKAEVEEWKEKHRYACADTESFRLEIERIGAESDAMKELLREIRDGEVNAQDEADKFLRDQEPSELSKLRAKLQYVASQLIEAGCDDGAAPVEELARRAKKDIAALKADKAEERRNLAMCRDALKSNDYSIRQHALAATEPNP